jgi:hypothetical protein
MSMPLPASARPAATRVIQTAAEAELLINDMNNVMQDLLRIIEQETELVRAGKLADAAQLEPQKSDLARRYVADATLVEANSALLKRYVAGQLGELRRRHERFHATLQMNLAVLATAHAVSEGIIRGVAGEVARKAAPRTYGMSGRPSAPPPVKPVALSRTM